MKKISLVLGLLIIISVVFSLFYKPVEEKYKKTQIKIGEVTVFTEISDTEELRNLGLSGRESLGANEGMLFVFDEPALHGFWMKDMKFSIDILWIDQNKIIGIEKSITPNTFPKAFYPPSEVELVLELQAGFADLHLVKVGDFLSIGL